MVDYSLNPSWSLHLGYRNLNFDITGSEGRFGFNVHMRGRSSPALSGFSGHPPLYQLCSYPLSSGGES